MERPSPIPLRPDPAALAKSALRSVARRALLSARTAAGAAPIANPWPDDPAVDWLTRSSVAPIKIGDAAALNQVRIFFLLSLIPVSAAAAVLSQALGFSFNGAAQISVPSLTLPSAEFVGEGAAIPVAQGDSSSNLPLTPAKLAVIVVLTREMIEGGDAENAMQQVLQENVGASLDLAFFNTNAAVAAMSPAGVLNGVAPLAVAGRTGAARDACIEDLSKLAQALAPVSGSSPPILIAAPQQASIIRSTILNPPPLYQSAALNAGEIVAIVPASIACAVGAPIIEASNKVSLHMSNPASDLVSVGSPGVVAAPQRSLFQTDSSALRFLMDVTWTRRGKGVAWLEGVNWP